MIKDITIGQYYPSNSIIHRLDPRVKLFSTMIYIASLFIINELWMYCVIFIALFTIIKLTKIPLKHIFKGLKPILVLLLITLTFNILFTPGEVICSFWKIEITKEGLKFAAFMGLRLIFLIVGTSLMTYTTTPNQLTDGIEKALGFLKKIRVPVSEIAMMISIALRFIPILIEEVEKIMKAQSARGTVFDEGSLIKRIRAMLPILIPLFFSAFRRADELAYAMEARCYMCGGKRTKFKPLKYTKLDFISYVVVICYLAIIISIRIVL